MLVTHGLSFLPQADLILVMEDGQIMEAGSYTELRERRNSFADLLKIFSDTEHRENSINRGESSSDTLVQKKTESKERNKRITLFIM